MEKKILESFAKFMFKNSISGYKLVSLPDSPASTPGVEVGEPARASGTPQFFQIFECSGDELCVPVDVQTEVGAAGAR
jgi:hypothetical protein